MFFDTGQATPSRNLRANRAKSALTAVLFLSFALASAVLMRGHASLKIDKPDPDLPGNGGNNNPGTSYTIKLEPPTNVGGDAWDKWIPEPSTTLEFTAIVKTSMPNGSVEFTFPTVTSYQGTYMNDSFYKGNTDPDLYFEKADEQAKEIEQGNLKIKLTWSVPQGSAPQTAAVSWESNPGGSLNLPVKVICNDYAAYGKLKAKLVGHDASDTITIPKDGNNNKMADGWKHDADFVLDDLKKDREIAQSSSVPSGRNSGDGFTLLEEYRGFKIRDMADHLANNTHPVRKHIRLNPYVKDIFIFSDVGEITNSGYSGAHNIGYASVPSYAMHLIHKDDTGENEEALEGSFYRKRSMNFCRGGMEGAMNQRAIGVEADDKTKPGYLGQTFPKVTNPQHHRSVKVYIAQIEQNFDSVQYRKAVLPVVIAHEVGHAVGLEHHKGTYDSGGMTFPGINDACVMFTLDGAPGGKLSQSDFEKATGSGYANRHSAHAPAKETLPDGSNSVWEHHQERYWLHQNHTGQKTYQDD